MSTVAPPSAVVRVDGLTLALRTGEPVVEDVSFSLGAGEILGLVGESGSGKTTTALALLGYTRPGVAWRSGTVEVGGEQVRGRDERSLRSLRGRVVSYVPQDPGGALNPSLRVGDAILDVLRAHRSGEGSPELGARGARPRGARRGRGLPSPLSPPALGRPAAARDDRDGLRLRAARGRARRADDGPRRAHAGSHPVRARPPAQRAGHGDGLRLARPRGRRAHGRPHRRHVRRPRRRERAGGRRDRAAAPSLHARARGGDPRLPAPALAAGHPRRLGRRGRVAEGLRLRAPLRARGRALRRGCAGACRRCARARGALLPHARDRAPPSALRARCARGRPLPRPPRCSRSRSSRRAIAAAARRAPPSVDVSFAIPPGRCVALVGESGSGKTTVGRCIAGLHRPSSGSILFAGNWLVADAAARPLDVRRRIQIVFQNPFESLNPRHQVRSSIARRAVRAPCP